MKKEQNTPQNIHPDTLLKPKGLRISDKEYLLVLANNNIKINSQFHLLLVGLMDGMSNKEATIYAGYQGKFADKHIKPRVKVAVKQLTQLNVASTVIQLPKKEYLIQKLMELIDGDNKDSRVKIGAIQLVSKMCGYDTADDKSKGNFTQLLVKEDTRTMEDMISEDVSEDKKNERIDNVTMKSEEKRGDTVTNLGSKIDKIMDNLEKARRAKKNYKPQNHIHKDLPIESTTIEPEQIDILSDISKELENEIGTGEDTDFLEEI